MMMIIIIIIISSSSSRRKPQKEGAAIGGRAAGRLFRACELVQPERFGKLPSRQY